MQIKRSLDKVTGTRGDCLFKMKQKNKKKIALNFRDKKKERKEKGKERRGERKEK